MCLFHAGRRDTGRGTAAGFGGDARDSRHGAGGEPAYPTRQRGKCRGEG